jgi:cytochrome c oxidase cbb3-type subunit III
VPTKIEKDSVTGRETTGHEWDGLRELNTPLPKWWLYVFYASCVVALVMFVLYPSFPYGRGYLHGVLGYSQRAKVDADVKALVAVRAITMDKIAALPLADIQQDPALVASAMTAGRVAFAENCKPCHGAGGGGQPGYPALAAGAWIWGGKPDDIRQTITLGIRSGAEGARDSQMPHFGADGILKPREIGDVADYVLATFYGKPVAGQDVSAGAKIFAENCATCHGETGMGNRDVGAPRLASRVHLYGDAREVVVGQITNPHMGVMPNWNARLNPGMINSLALYVHGLGGGE